MNIEESIEILESYKESLEEYEDNPRIIQAIETLLTAYEKEKEKNKELEDTRSIFNMGRRSYKNEIEGKIKARIEKLEDMYNELPKNPKEHLHSKTEYKIVIGELQSLLEKE